ncbi:MAG: tryptophan 7-halogenase [Verrucomicrobiota bacterium]
MHLPSHISHVLVLGGGSAGLLAALTLKRRIPALRVQLVYSSDIGVIGVGEGTTQLFPKFLFNTLRLKPAQFYSEVQPTWKLGIRFLWGPRSHFHYSFTRPIDRRLHGLAKNNGFYCSEDFSSVDPWYALMEYDNALPRGADGKPDFDGHASIAFHLENKKLVSYLDRRCRDFGVEMIDAKVDSVETSERGIEMLVLNDGRRLTADLFVDASGFASELLGRALEVPFHSYADSLFCNRAVIGGWERTDEPIRPYTVAETMDAGWAWQIEHEHFINRGYVYSSRFIDDETARAELLSKNPKIKEARVVGFRSGRYAAMWKGNVVGIGNASGFVEPLEASALQVIISQCDLSWPTPSMIKLYNQFATVNQDEIRDFLAVHYKFNTRLDTPFWKTCQKEISLGGAEALVEFYRENGPSALGRSSHLSWNNPYGIEGYLALLIGQNVPYARRYLPDAEELRVWRRHIADNIVIAKRGFGVKQALEIIRRPGWTWS